MKRLVATPVSRALALSDGRIMINRGTATIKLEYVDGSEGSGLALGRISFSVMPPEMYLGQGGFIRVWWQRVFMGSYQLNNFGPTHVEFRVRDFRSPSHLSLKFDGERDATFYARSFEDYSADQGPVIGDLAIHATNRDQDARYSLVGAARAITLQLGLCGEHLTPRRAAALRAAVTSSLRKRRGFSIVRVGDGEGRVLGYPLVFNDQEVLSQVLHYQFGPESMTIVRDDNPDNWVASAIMPLQEMLSSSLRNADAVGLPVRQNVSEEALRTRPDGALGYATGLLSAVGLTAGIPASMRFGVNVFQVAAASYNSFFSAAAQAARSVYLVGPWDLREPFARAAGVRHALHIRVPGHYTWRGSKGLGQIPELYRFVESQISAAGDLSGDLFLVGAGILGKHYCNLIKTRGGVALDIGSVFDSWAGRGRPEAVQARHISLNGAAGK
jgi:hypothetical protein